jgi:hypothetical protein
MKAESLNLKFPLISSILLVHFFLDYDEFLAFWGESIDKLNL